MVSVPALIQEAVTVHAVSKRAFPSAKREATDLAKACVTVYPFRKSTTQNRPPMPSVAGRTTGYPRPRCPSSRDEGLSLYPPWVA